MKLRLTKNSIRFRLSQSDVQAFRTEGFIREELRIGPTANSALVFGLVRSMESENVSVTFENNQITISVPTGEADSWSTTERVGIEATQPASDGTNLSILIEKDFACLTPRPGDDDKDSFPHPEAANG